MRDRACDDEPTDRRTAVAISPNVPDEKRRRLLRVIGAGSVVVLAGCLEAEEEEPNEDDEEVATYELQFLDAEETVEVAEDEEILYPALDADVDIPYDCEVGVCGDCTARYDGDATDVVSHDGNDYLEDDQIEDGWILTCVAYPEDDFDLEVAHPDDE